MTAGSAGGSGSLVLYDVVDVLVLGLAVVVLVAALHFARRARARREPAWPFYLLAVCTVVVAVGRLLS
ncbi:hypothetical protein [Nocardioides flavescens]|uniref:Uncharacterized protein n=1 Tax=Nocardioides flavescens TaxID=2691959 RepID=A0A6L7F396_9ACTN|nr:hypothetical protein [Nocardioides flavescens]MXG91514.1 hypothetical protein [Nocardioides flavescens]